MAVERRRRPGDHAGLRHGGYHAERWNFGGHNPIIHADFLPAEIDEHYNPQVALAGNVARTLRMLNERFTRGGVPDYGFTLQRRIRALMVEDFAGHLDDAAETSIRRQEALWDVRQVLDRQDILLADAGAF